MSAFLGFVLILRARSELPFSADFVEKLHYHNIALKNRNMVHGTRAVAKIVFE
tara:strand:+ start:714 stop:872 length:159 start_codon:yes stop_codon:yes gene_type:complete